MALGDLSGLADAYTALRPMLERVAYAVLGSRAEAEDVVSDCWLRLIEAHQRESIRDLEAWATVAVSRRALDVLRSARVAREGYVGPWLPEPVLDDRDADPADRVTLDETVSYALLVVLETLTPAERTAFVLHDLFGMAFAEVGGVVGRSDAAVRQLAARARRHVAAGTPRTVVSPHEHRATLEAFVAACEDGDLNGLLELLHPTVTLVSDGGGRVVAAKRPVRGAAKVARFLLRLQSAHMTPEQRAELRGVNGLTGLVITEPTHVDTVMSFTLDGPRIARIDIVRAPDKLAALR